MKRKRATRSAETEALEAVRAACTEAQNGEHFDLYWLGRRPVYDILDDPKHEGRAGAPAIKKILAKYGKKAKEIADGDAWEHGFHAGALAFARLVQGLAVTEPWTCEYSGMTASAEEQRLWAREEYPMLDS